MANCITRHIPNAVTCCNLFSGCIASVMAFNEDYTLAISFIILGAVSVSLAAWCFAAYSRQLKINIKWFITFMIVMFSLNKWEMLTNGSG